MKKVTIYKEKIETFDRSGTEITITLVGLNKQALLALSEFIHTEGRKRGLIGGGSSATLSCKEIQTGVEDV